MKTLRGPTIVSIGWQAPVTPINTAAPVASGTAKVGFVLSCTTGTWSNSPTSYAYRWQRDGVNVSGATANTYTVVAADIGAMMTCNVTATNGFGSTVATSNARGPVLSSMPAGALTILFADAYDTTLKAIPNDVSAAPLSTNIYRASRRMFTRDEWWSKIGTGTITDDVAAGPDGADNDASSLNMSAGNWGIHSASTNNVPAGTYTICVSAKSNTGSNQQFAFSKDNTGTRSPAKTATTAWQNFTYVFTLAAPTNIGIIYLCSVDGATAANILIRDLELHPGDVSASWTHQSYAGHGYFGITSLDTTHSYSGGSVDISTGGVGLIQTAANATISSTGVTAIALLSRVAAGSTYEAFVSKVQAYTQFSAFTSLANAPTDFAGAVYGEAGGSGLWLTQGAGFHCFGHRYDGANRDLWIDDMRVHRKAATQADFTLRDFYIGFVNSMSLSSGYKIAAIGIWPRALTDTEYRQVVFEFQGRAAISGISAPSLPRFVAFAGDSRTGSTTTRWPFAFGPNASPAVLGVNLGISGSTLANLQSRIDEVTGIGPPAGVGSGRKFIAVVGQMGANDLAGYTGATDAIAAQNYANAMGTYTDALYASGVTKVVLCTEPPALAAGTNPHNTRKALLNTIYKTAYPGSTPVLIADFAADAIMGPDNSFTVNPTYWSDATHQSALGDGRYEPIVRPVINGI